MKFTGQIDRVGSSSGTGHEPNGTPTRRRPVRPELDSLLRLGRSASIGAFPDKDEDEQHFLPINEEFQSYVSHEIDRFAEKTKVARKKFTEAWAVCHFNALPKWMQDNDYLHEGHRPELACFKACFWSIFRLHTETGNIWTHLLGTVLFIVIACYVYLLYPHQLQFYDKLAFGAFFLGTISCLAFSSIFHTMCCHSRKVCKKFNRLDYCGISLLISGSFVPWLYYAFYCSYLPKVCHLVLVLFFGATTIAISLYEKFAEPDFRLTRALTFAAFGLSAVIPTFHWLFTHTWYSVDSLRMSIMCLFLMGALYLLGALLYAARIPERYFPGKCDYYFQSHQLFHILVIVAAVVHYKGVSEMAHYRLSNSNAVCESDLLY